MEDETDTVMATIDIAVRLYRLRNISNYKYAPVRISISTEIDGIEATPYQLLSQNK